MPEKKMKWQKLKKKKNIEEAGGIENVPEELMANADQASIEAMMLTLLKQ